MEAYSKLFLAHGYVASQILITRSDFSDECRYHNVRNTMNVLWNEALFRLLMKMTRSQVNRLRFGDNDTLASEGGRFN